MDDLEYIRRILISWLAGRPVSRIAERAGCSERSVRNVVRKVIYVDEDELDFTWSLWCELGLIGALDVAAFSHTRLWPAESEASLATVICQVCHRQAGVVHIRKSLLGEPTGAQIELDTLVRGVLMDDRLARKRVARVQGHLMLHFFLGADAIGTNIRRAKQRAHRELQRTGWISGNRPFAWYPNRHHYTQFVSRHAIGELPEDGAPDKKLLTPVIDGRPVSIYDARRRWKRLI